MFTDYWKVLVLNFPEMGNTVFSWDKKLMERWCLLITQTFLFWTIRWWEIRSFLGQKVDGKMISTDYWKVIVLSFSEIENMVFFEPKSWWKDDIYLFLLSHPRYSRAWKIWFFVQCSTAVVFPQIFTFFTASFIHWLRGVAPW